MVYKFSLMAKKRSAKEDIGESAVRLMQSDSFYAWDGDVLVVNILGTPSSKRDAIGKPKGNQLKVSVTAAPNFGKATDHMVRFLAREFEVSAKDIEVVFGQFNVNKQLRIKNPQKLPSTIIPNDILEIDGAGMQSIARKKAKK